MTSTQKLVQEIRDLQIQLDGKRIELAMALGDRASAEYWKRKMYAAIECRNAANQVEQEAANA